ncbi:hypothetical protein DFH05DRAFT_1614472 [Lentinula detonsa]|uniref:Uncharacterized protein n=1 Tax=Lentinula detonsa TaxID=2804962 RepID=A0A9W8TYL6_9AGAR|nr:hypothetical protein DFH05DRAFT_1614472 [Lentinula detonsa]
MNGEIPNEEALLGAFKRRKARTQKEIKSGALSEHCEKWSIGTLVFQEISHKTSQLGLPRLPYTAQSKIQPLLHTALQHGEAVAFTSFSLGFESKQSLSLDLGRTLYHQWMKIAVNRRPLLGSSNLLGCCLGDVFQQQGADVTFNPAANNGELSLISGWNVAFELHIVGAETQQATPTPTITPLITMAPPVLSSGDVIPSLPPSDETNESVSRSMGRNMTASSMSGGRGGHFAAFLARRRMSDEADISTDQSTVNPSTARTNVPDSPQMAPHIVR